eukprot:747969-Hanusia_phi.AAC.1
MNLPGFGSLTVIKQAWKFSRGPAYSKLLSEEGIRRIFYAQKGSDDRTLRTSCQGSRCQTGFRTRN